MLVVANRNNLEIYSRRLLGRAFCLDKEAELIRVAMNGFTSQRAGRFAPHMQAAHLEQLNKVLGTHGVESLPGTDVSYCNTGDTYGMTLLYYRGRLMIGDWGSIVEKEAR